MENMSKQAECGEIKTLMNSIERLRKTAELSNMVFESSVSLIRRFDRADESPSKPIEEAETPKRRDIIEIINDLTSHIDYKLNEIGGNIEVMIRKIE